ncbi:MAG: hypothetical protein KY464_09060, partial [Gemmatimonadetes bacterium]|nr:hypothetical protein [Gemmatimonadota bacterium]
MTIRDFLERSSATPAFQDAIRAFVRTGAPNDRVGFEAYSPPVKIERTLTKMLAAYPNLAIDRVEIRGSSGCEYFSGKLTIHALDGEREVLFHWDCKWRAQQQGWVDYFGFPDQTRAAREFGYDCFREWTE